MLRKFFDTFFKGDFPTHGKQVFREHYEEIRRLTPPDNLLEYRVTEGWKPLCDFLQHEVPAIEFPRGNSMEDFITRCRLRNKKQMWNAALRALVSGRLMDVVEALGGAEAHKDPKTELLQAA
jgi:hypothetical protein